MAVDIKAIKAKLAALEESSQRKVTHAWKPVEGSQIIRIVPNMEDKDNPFAELFFHYQFGGKTLLSPKTFGNPDPIEEFGLKLMSPGASKEEWKMGKSILPVQRIYVPIIVRGKESEGVKWWNFATTIHKELLKIMADDDYGDYTDLKNGRDITVEFIPKEKTKTSYPETTIRIKPNTSPATTDKAIAQLIKDQPKLSEMFVVQTYEQLEAVLEKWLNPDETPAAEEAKPSAKGSKVAESTAKVVSNASDVGKAFDDMFDDDEDTKKKVTEDDGSDDVPF